MKKLVILTLIITFSLLILQCNKKPADVEAPVAEKKPHELTIHGDTRIDNYFWMNQRENKEVIAHLNAENEYKDMVMKHTEKLQKKLYKEIIGRIKKDDESVPYKDNGFYYYRRYVKGGEYPIYARKHANLDNDEEILLNVNEMAEGYAFYQVRGLNISFDNNLLAFGEDTVSRRKYTIYFKDLTTGKVFDDKISNTTGGSVWANDNKTVYYAVKDSTLRPHKIFKHILGTDPAGDIEVYHESDYTFETFVYKSKSDKYIIIGSYSTLSTEYRYLDADNTEGEFIVFNPREENHEYSIAHFEDKFYVVTNWKAKNFRLMETSINATSDFNWTEVIPHREDVLLQDIDIFKNYLVVSERANGLRQLRIINQRDNSEHYIEFDEDTYLAFSSDNHEFDSDLLRFRYTSLTTPFTTYDYDMITKERNMLKQEEIVGKFNPNSYQSERHFATADDGTKVPISLVYKKGIGKDGTNPVLLYGYGSYGSSMETYFSSNRLSLLDRGFVFAIAHIRGGQEMGRYWYEDGKLLKKKNTFTDFIDCAEYLINEKFTNSGKLFAMGGSAGGLLVGAVSNMHPELFKGIVADVPWVDIVTTMLDDTIPLTTSEFDEWGNPNDKEYYDYMLSYSPYDNVIKQDYPAMLVITGLHDSQVQYFEPAKWVAKLRELKTDDNMLVLDINMDVGHGGASGRFERNKEIALKYAFMLDQLGIRK
ncbi:MAG: S9 family peptidase [Candidatus Neomarinimicrobiota bacterium]